MCPLNLQGILQVEGDVVVVRLRAQSVEEIKITNMTRELGTIPARKRQLQPDSVFGRVAQKSHKMG